MTNYSRRDKLPFGPLTKAAARYLALHRNDGKGIEYNPEWTPEGNKPARFRWVEHPGKGLRFVGKAHEIRGSEGGNLPYFDRSLVNHTGWFTDIYQDGETVCGEVYQLPARNGQSLYVPAVSDAYGNEGSILDFHSITDDLKDAVRWSDSMAERIAEDDREFSLKANVEDRIEQIDEQVKSKRAEFLALAKEIRANCDKVSGLKFVRKAIRDSAQAMRQEIRKLTKEKQKLTDNPYSLMEGF